MVKCIFQSMWTHLGAPKLCLQMGASNQVLRYPCVPCIMFTTPTAKHVPTTNSSRRSTIMTWNLPKQLKPVLTPAVSFTWTQCLIAASMQTTWWSSVKHATRYVTSEINCFRHSSIVWWELWLELWWELWLELWCELLV